jgi:hypothetical protein
MLCLDMFPQPSLVFSCPETDSTLPQVAILAHFLCDLRLKIYTREVNFCSLFQSQTLGALMVPTFMVMPSIFGWTEF